MVDTVFVDWEFPATGAPAMRTLPDRLSDIVNVKDWGAIGDQTHNDAPNINAAIQFCISRGGGTVYFPAGSYALQSPVECGHDSSDVGVRLVGTGMFNSILIPITGYTDPLDFGFILSKGRYTYDCIEAIEFLTPWTVRCTRDGAMFVSGQIGMASGKAACDFSSVKNGLITGCRIGGDGTGYAYANNPTTSFIHGAVPDTVAISIGHGKVVGCRGGGFYEIAYAHSGYGSVNMGCSSETVGMGVRCGWASPFTLAASDSSTDTITFASTLPNAVIEGRYVSGTNIPADTYITAINSTRTVITLSQDTTGDVTSVLFDWETPCYGGYITGYQTERVAIGVELYNCKAIILTASPLSLGEALPLGATIDAISWAGGTATVTTTEDHNLPTGDSVLMLTGANGIGWNGNIDFLPPNPPYTSGFGNVAYIVATRTGVRTFTYPLPDPSGTYTPPGNKDEWTWPNGAAIRVRKAENCVLKANSPSRIMYFASFDLDYDGEAIHQNNVCIAERGASSWRMPSAANMASWKFINCSGGSDNFNNAPDGTVTPFGTMTDILSVPYGYMEFAMLPGQSGVNQPLIEGQVYDIIDGQKSGGGAATFNDIVVGGSSGHYKVRYDGTNWRRIG